MGVVEQQPFYGYGSSNALVYNKANVLQPIEFPTMVAAPPQLHPPTQFHKWAALRQCSTNKLELDVQVAMQLPTLDERLEKNMKIAEEMEIEEGLNYNSDEVEIVEIDKLEENGNNGGTIE